MPKKLEVNGVIIKRTTLAKYFSRVNPAAGKTVVYYVPGIEDEFYPSGSLGTSTGSISLPFGNSEDARRLLGAHLKALEIIGENEIQILRARQAELLGTTPHAQRRAEKNSVAQSFIDFYFTLYESLLKLPHPRPPQEPAHKRAAFYRDLQQKLRGATHYSDAELRAAATLYLEAAAAGTMTGSRDIEAGYTIHLFLSAAPGWILKVRRSGQSEIGNPKSEIPNDLPFGAAASW